MIEGITYINVGDINDCQAYVSAGFSDILLKHQNGRRHVTNGKTTFFTRLPNCLIY
jgi:hypothetical protein